MRVRQPVVIRRLPDLKAAVATLSSYDAFIIDVETVGKTDAKDAALDFRTNTITWIGLGTYGEVYLIPMQHKHGRLLREDHWTLGGKPSKAKNPPIIDRVFAKPGEQLMPDVVMREIESLLFSEHQITVGHNLKFDLMSLAKYYRGRLPAGPYFDTMIAYHVTDENQRSYKLKDIIPNWFKVPKAERPAFYPNLARRIAEEPIDAVARYLARDVRYDWLLFQDLREELRYQGLTDVFRMEMDVYPAIMSMEMQGAYIDPVHLAEMEATFQAQVTALEEQVWTESGVKVPFPLTNVEQKRELLFKPKIKGGQGLRPLKLTPKQKVPVLDQATLEYYADRNELARLFLAWSETNKILSTFVRGLQKKVAAGDTIHTSLLQHGTVTGRLSSRNPNLQNIPRESDVRALFVAPEGYSLVVADYDQIEMRVLTHFCRDPEMLRIFREGEDIHAGTIAAILDIDIEEVSKAERQVGKTLNFAVVYGAGVHRVAGEAGVSVVQAQRFLDRYYERFAAIKPWKNRVLSQARRNGDPAHPIKNPPYVTTLLGRRRRLPGLFSYDSGEVARAERQAINTRVQGTAAEIMKIALVRLHRDFLGTPYRLVLTVHDETLTVCPEGDEEAAKRVVSTAMSGILLGGEPILSVPLVVTCGTAKRWSTAKG